MDHIYKRFELLEIFNGKYRLHSHHPAARRCWQHVVDTFGTGDTEPGSEKWLEINTKYSEIWPNISEKKDPPPDHEKFKDEQNKYEKYFKENL